MIVKLFHIQVVTHAEQIPKVICIGGVANCACIIIDYRVKNTHYFKGYYIMCTGALCCIVYLSLSPFLPIHFSLSSLLYLSYNGRLPVLLLYNNPLTNAFNCLLLIQRETRPGKNSITICRQHMLPWQLLYCMYRCIM